jgi:hypothetical protein
MWGERGFSPIPIPCLSLKLSSLPLHSAAAAGFVHEEFESPPPPKQNLTSQHALTLYNAEEDEHMYNTCGMPENSLKMLLKTSSACESERVSRKGEGGWVWGVGGYDSLMNGVCVKERKST